VISNGAIVQAVDYDLGPNGYAYSDMDTASYHYTPGVNTRGNRGGVYRNDGVDIRSFGSDYEIFSIEDGEWLQYTVEAPVASSYTMQVKLAKDAADAVFSVMINGKTIAQDVQGPSGAGWQQVPVKQVKLQQGINRIRIYFTKGGCLFQQLQFQQR
jgi:hypothetical protein